MLMFALLAALACGGSPVAAPLEVPRLETGRYTFDTYPGETRGACSFVPRKGFRARVGVDSEGHMVSPLPGTVSCFTVYSAPAVITIVCKALGNSLELQGEVVDTQHADLVGEARGNIAGCTYARVRVWMELEL